MQRKGKHKETGTRPGPHERACLYWAQLASGKLSHSEAATEMVSKCMPWCLPESFVLPGHRQTRDSKAMQFSPGAGRATSLRCDGQVLFRSGVGASPRAAVVTCEGNERVVTPSPSRELQVLATCICCSRCSNQTSRWRMVDGGW